MIDLLKSTDYRKFFSYAAPLLILLILEFLFYQAYFFIPVKVNGKDYMARKGTTAWAFLNTAEVAPPHGNLLDVKKKLLKKGEGEPPVIQINGKARLFTYRLNKDDVIETFVGKDKIEPIVKEQVFIEKPIENYGHGSFIIIEREGKMGLKEVRYGKYSKKVLTEKLLSKPIPTGISKINIRERRAVALTFDDGPSKYTKYILRILKKHKIKATFFVLGRNVVQHPSMLKKIKQNGHIIGNHTFNHISMQKSTAKRIRGELKKTDQVIHKIIGIRPKWIRPPGGGLRQAVINFVVLGGKNISLWNIDTGDWRRPPPSAIKNEVLSNLAPGQVILMHDGGGNRANTVKALPIIIRELKDRNYKFVTLDHLFKLIRPYD